MNLEKLNITNKMEQLEDIIEIKDPDIDVKAIIKNIRDRIEEKKKAGIYKDDPLLCQSSVSISPDSIDLSLNEKLNLIKMLANVDIEGEPITSHRPVVGFFIKGLKKLSKFWVRKYTDSIFAKQSQFNNEIVTTLRKISGDLEEIKTLLKNGKGGNEK